MRRSLLGPAYLSELAIPAKRLLAQHTRETVTCDKSESGFSRVESPKGRQYVRAHIVLNRTYDKFIQIFSTMVLSQKLKLH